MSIWSPHRSGWKSRGYIHGDFYPLMSIGAQAKAYSNFTATSYAWDWQFFVAKFTPGALGLKLGHLQVAAALTVDPGTDETVDLQLYDQLNNVSLAEVAGITGTGEQVTDFPRVSLDVTDETEEQFLVFRWKESPGSNATAAKYPNLVIGEEVQ